MARPDLLNLINTLGADQSEGFMEVGGYWAGGIAGLDEPARSRRYQGRSAAGSVTTRSLPLSATNRLPAASNATAPGSFSPWNGSSVGWSRPTGSSSTRLAPVSTTKRLPA